MPQSRFHQLELRNTFPAFVLKNESGEMLSVKLTGMAFHDAWLRLAHGDTEPIYSRHECGSNVTLRLPMLDIRIASEHATAIMIDERIALHKLIAHPFAQVFTDGNSVQPRPLALVLELLSTATAPTSFGVPELLVRSNIRLKNDGHLLMRVLVET